MTTIELVTFVGAATLLAFTPGPDLLFVLTEGMLRGRRAGLVGAVGLSCGLLVHIAATTLGVAALVQSSQAAFTALRYIGAAYLVYLAWKAFAGRHAAQTRNDIAQGALWGIYRRAVLMNVTNPKVALFFLAFLPQFTHPERGGMATQMLTLGGLFMVCALVSFAIVAVAAAPVGAWLRRSPSREAKLNLAAALIFAAIAAKLIVG